MWRGIPTARAVRIVVSRHQALEAMRRAGELDFEHGRDVTRSVDRSTLRVAIAPGAG